MKKIIMVGCGEHARMVLDNIEEQGVYKVLGFTTNNKAELNSKIRNYPIIGLDSEIPEIIKKNNNIEGYFLGVGNMKIRVKLYTWLDTLLPAVNIIHPTAIVSSSAKIGHGNIFEAFTKIANGTTVGNHCIVNSFTAVNHDQTIEDNVLLAGNVSMAGKRIGANTIISDGASIGFKRSVGKCCIIGDGSVVSKDIPDNTIAYGNPAKIIRSNNW